MQLDKKVQDMANKTTKATEAQASKKAGTAETFTLKELEAMSIKELKAQIAKHGRAVPTGAFEKSEFQAVLRDLAKPNVEETEESVGTMFASFRNSQNDAKADWEDFKQKFTR